MKIIYCIDSLSSSGGTERVLSTKVNWLAQQKNIEVILISIKEDKPPFFYLHTKIRHIVLDINLKNRGAYKNALLKIVEKEHPDVMVAVSGYAVKVLPTLKDGSKKILEFHYTKNFLVNFVKGIQHLRFRQLHILKMKWLQWKLAQQARKYDIFVGLTAKDVDLWGNPKNMTYIHNPLSFRSEIKSNCKNKIIISVGSWTPAKGMDQLLEAFGPLAHDYPEWKVELYGSGQDEHLLRSIIRKYNMDRQIIIHPPVKDIAERLINAAVYAFPSRSDGFGLVITEAMECGLPTVAMDCPCGPCEIVSSATGIVVPEMDVVSFRNALKLLMDNPDLRKKMGYNASTEVARFYPDNIMSKWLHLFSN